MNENDPVLPLARRSFLTHVGAGATILGASIAATGAPAAGAQSISGPRWQAARHEEDAWFDQIPGKHRLIFDTTTPDGANWDATFANNYYTANGPGYGLKDADLAVICHAA
jgi:LPS sulfotransferase NodH